MSDDDPSPYFTTGIVLLSLDVEFTEAQKYE